MKGTKEMKTTPLFPIYQNSRAKVIDFHDWSLPLQFSGIIEEHQAVRDHVGLFDVSHMGELLVKGPQALPFLEFVLTNRISSLEPGHIRYSPLCQENGGTIDDLLIYCFDYTQYLLIVNASNLEIDCEWLKTHALKFSVSIEDIAQENALLAIQGPAAYKTLEKLSDRNLINLGYYQFEAQIKLAGISVLLSRTGYTGEDGFEIFVKPEKAIVLWEILMEAGAAYNLKPIGLGARDTLRFEAGLPLHGNELSLTISPLEAGLARFVKLDKESFIGKETLLEQYLKGTPRRLAGIEMLDRGIPRSECLIFKDEQHIGFVTSGSYAPTLKKNLAMILIYNPFGTLDEEVQVEIRGKLLTGKIVKLPFYSRRKGLSK
jgi:aminomethyltransferase